MVKVLERSNRERAKGRYSEEKGERERNWENEKGEDRNRKRRDALFEQ